MKPGYVEEAWQFAKEHTGMLVLLASGCYGLGWVMQSMTLSRLGVGDISLAREKTFATGMVLLVLLWPFLSGQMVIRWRSKKPVLRPIMINLLDLTTRGILVIFLTCSPDQFRTKAAWLLLALYVGIGLALMWDQYRDKKSYALQSLIPLAGLLTMISVLYPRIARPTFGGLSDVPVRIRLKDLSHRDVNVVAEDDKWLIYYKGEGNGLRSHTRISKDQIESIEQ